MTFTNSAATAKETAPAYTAALLELLGDRDPLEVLSDLVAEVARMVSGLDDATLRRHEREGKWSMLEVVQHLVDTELIYGYRVRMILAHDMPAIEGYDQDAWARSLRYNDGDIRDALDELRVLRKRNLRLLRSLGNDELERYGMHAERGPESVRRIAQLVAAHDLVHRRQLARIRDAVTGPARA